MKAIVSQLNDKSLVELTAKCFLLYMVIYAIKLNAVYVFPFLVIILGIAIVYKDFYKKIYFWILMLSLFVPNLVFKYNLLANHFFLMIYISMGFLISLCYKSESDSILQKNAKIILALVMCFAVFQKLISTQFMSGETIAFLGYTGELFKLPLKFSTTAQEAIQYNLSQLQDITINQAKDLKAPFPYFQKFVHTFTYITLIAEILFALLLFLKPKVIKNWFFIIFIIMLMLTRQENGFIALVCILLIMQLGKTKTLYRSLYFVLFLISISLILVKWGFI